MNPPANPVALEGALLPPLKSFSVSILVPTFNRANYIAECLDSLLAQTMHALEIIVIDDGSEDGTAEVLRSYGERIRYVRKENGGKPTAVNLGLTLAQGELIWIFDDDDVALPEAIANRVSTLQTAPTAAFVYTPHFYGSDGPDKKILQGRLHALPEHNPDSFLYELMKCCFFHLATALVRADAYRRVGSFDTRLLSSEDYDMQLRLARDYTAAYCSKPSFIFRQHTGVRGAKAIRYAGNERATVFRKFDQRIGQKIRASLPLGDYLVPRQTTISTQNAQQQALLARMTVMASKGCLPEMMMDLQDVLALLPSDTMPEQAISEAIANAICTGYAADAIANQWLEFEALTSKLPPTPAGRKVARSLAKGLFRLATGYPATLAGRWLRLKQSTRIAIHSLTLTGVAP